MQTHPINQRIYSQKVPPVNYPSSKANGLPASSTSQPTISADFNYYETVKQIRDQSHSELMPAVSILDCPPVHRTENCILVKWNYETILPIIDYISTFF